MTGPEHYREAEVQLRNAERHNTEHPGDMRIAEISAVTAQVHATLALAAVTAAYTLPVSDASEGWREAISS